MIVGFKAKKLVEVLFSGAGVVRQYASASAPLQRIILNPGQKAVSKEGQSSTIARVAEQEGLCLYYGEANQQLWEYDRHHQIEDLVALSRLLAGQWSAPAAFDLRRSGWVLRGECMDPEVRGLVGSRVTLLPHQLYVAREVTSREVPRVLLGDEVGLG